MIRFFIALGLLTGVIVGFTLAGVYYGYFLRPSFLLQTIILLFFATSLLYRYLYKANKPEYFSQLYLLSMVLKFIAFLAYCLLMILKDRSGALENIVFFLISYFSFTALEITFLYRKIARDNSS